MTADDWPDGPAHLHRGHRDRRRDARARGARLGPLRPVASGRMPAGRPIRRPDGVLGWTALGGYSARTRLQRRRVGERLRRGGGPRSRRRSRPPRSADRQPPRRPATGRCSPASWPRTRPASRSTSGSGSGGSASSARIGQDAAGRWRDVVLLERRSEIVGYATERSGHEPPVIVGSPRPLGSRRTGGRGGSRPRRAGPSGRS